MRKNDELFYKFNGETIKFEEDEPYIPVFINEAAYMEKNIAMSFTKKELLKMTKKESKEFMIKCNSIRRRVDLNNAKKELKEHYDLNRPVVVDGQQRLTTLLLGCALLIKMRKKLNMLMAVPFLP